MFKQLFPTLLIPTILLGAGCASSPQTRTEPVSAPEKADETSVKTEVAFEDGSYILNAQESSIAWNARKRIGAKHRGTVEVHEGAWLVQDGRIVSGSLVVDMTTIVDFDLVDEELNRTLVNHLKSDDFFAVATYPIATFAINEVAKLEGIQGATHRVTGIMIIKGIENEISFPAAFETKEAGIRVTGTATLDRTRWDVRYGSDRFFDNLGDELIEDDFTLTVDMLFVPAK